RTARAPAGTAMSTAPTTPSVSSSPAASAVSIAHDASGRPRNGASSLWSVPSKRAPAPAASTTAATVTSVDRPGGLAQRHRPAGPARAKGDDLGADRDRRLLRRAGTDVEPDGSHQARQPLVIDPFGSQPGDTVGMRAPRAHGAEVADLRVERGDDRGNVELCVVGQHAHRVARTETRRPPRDAGRASRPRPRRPSGSAGEV